jgi:uncharacterized protein YlxW (UPF0749 family)
MPESTDQRDERDEHVPSDHHTSGQPGSDTGSHTGPHTGSHTGPSGRQRLLAELRRARKGQVVVAVLLAVVGFGAVTQVRTNGNDATYAGYREQDLIDVLSGLAGASQRAQSELSQLERTRAKLSSATEQRQAALDQAQSQVDTLNILAGRVPVTGPGIRITITETTDEVDVDSFLDLVEELRSTGAEAIEVNGKARLVAGSALEQGADGLYVDHRLLTPPYTIEAIGDPSALAAAVTFARGPEYEFSQEGAEVKVTQETTLDITAVTSAQ